MPRLQTSHAGKKRAAALLAAVAALTPHAKSGLVAATENTPPPPVRIGPVTITGSGKSGPIKLGIAAAAVIVAAFVIFRPQEDSEKPATKVNRIQGKSAVSSSPVKSGNRKRAPVATGVRQTRTSFLNAATTDADALSQPAAEASIYAAESDATSSSAGMVTKAAADETAETFGTTDNIQPVAHTSGVADTFEAVSETSVSLIIESCPEGKNHHLYKEITGSWETKNAYDNAYKSREIYRDAACGARSVTIGTAAAPAALPARARFTADFTGGPATWYVYATWPETANSSKVTYEVKHGDSIASVTLKQIGFSANPVYHDWNYDKWNYVGKWEFTPGKDMYVDVVVPGDAKPLTKSFEALAFADAVMFTDSPVIDARSIFSFIGNDDLDKAKRMAADRQMKLLLFWHDDRAPLSRYYEGEIFSDPAFAQRLRTNYLAIRINFAQAPELSSRLKVMRGGVILTFDKAGKPITRIDKKLTPAELSRALEF